MDTNGLADYFAKLQENPMFNMGMALMSQWKTPYGVQGSLSGAMKEYQDMQMNKRRNKLLEMEMTREERRAKQEADQAAAQTNIMNQLPNFYKPELKGSLEQGKIGPGIDMASEQAKMLMGQEIDPGVAEMVSETGVVPERMQGTLADTLKNINSSANYVQQGTPNEMPLVGQPGGFDKAGFQQATMADRFKLDPKGTLADLIGGGDVEYGTTVYEDAQGNVYRIPKNQAGLVPVPNVKAPQKDNAGYKERVNVKGSNYIKEYSNDGGKTWQAFSDPYPIKSTVANVTAVANAGDKGLSEYWKTTADAKAKQVAEMEKQAQVAVQNINAIDRFTIESKKGTAGGAQPILTGVQNFLSTFGYSSSELDSVAKMQTAVAGAKANYMKQLGARGLTDQDMKILAESLPRVETSRSAREAVAAVLRKAYQKDIDNWAKEAEKQYRNAPEEMKPLMELPAWYYDYKNGGGGWKDL